MRISVIPGDPGYDQQRYAVTLDGQAIMSPVIADEERGFVTTLASGPDGELLRQENGNLVLTTLHGKVMVTPIQEERDWDKRRRGETRVQVGRQPNGDLVVQVFSVVRPGAIKQATLALKNQPRDLAQAAGVMAGGLAELLAEQFGDFLDPSAAANMARHQCLVLLNS
jgi:hypothetical protein